MHGCGHDEHTVSRLAASRYLAKSKEFVGTVQLSKKRKIRVFIVKAPSCVGLVGTVSLYE